MMSDRPSTKRKGDNAIRMLPMADMFDLQIVKDRIENFLLFTDLISIHRMFLIAEEHKLEILKKEIMHKYKNDEENRRDLVRSPEYDEFPAHLVKDIFSHIHG